MTTQSFFIGDARISVLNLGELYFDLGTGLNVPVAERPAEYAELFAQQLHVPINSILIETAGTSILVDPGSVHMPPGSPYVIPGYQPPPDLAAQLASMNVSPETVEHVVITHMHFDHYNGTLTDAGNLLFANAAHHIGRADWQRPAFQEAATRPDSLESKLANALNGSEQLHLVDGDYELTEGVTIIHTPGETQGHQAVRVASGGQVLYCVGDLYHHPLEVAHPGWMTHWSDREANLASKERIATAALAENAILIATHIPGAGRLESTGSGLRWQSYP